MNRFLFSGFVALFLVGFIFVQPVFAQDSQDVFVVFESDSSSDTRVVAESSFASIGGSVAHVYDDGVVLGSVPEGVVVPEVLIQKSGSFDVADVSDFGESVVQSARAWNVIQEQSGTQEVGVSGDSPLRDVPDVITEKRNSLRGSASGGNKYDASEYMLGSISVAVILTESNGSIDAQTENWSSTEEAQVQAEITEGLDWWVDRSGEFLHAPISFTTHFYNGRIDSRAQTSYEPITRSSDDDDDTWADEIMANFGYNDPGGYFFDAYDFIDDMRKADGTDWGVIVFVADSSADVDGEFADGAFAYAYLGGPSIQMTYDNTGYGIANMEAVMAHELGHSFYALDQYAAAGSDCTLNAGYLSVQNQNSLYNVNGGGCSSNVNSIMRSTISEYNAGALDVYARGQIGWQDSDSDRIPDILDVTPSVSINTSDSAFKTYSPTITGSVVLPRTENVNPYQDSVGFSGYGTVHKSIVGGSQNDITIDSLSRIEYRIDGGAWTQLATNVLSHDFSITPTLSNGFHTLEVQAISDVNAVVGSAAYTFEIAITQVSGPPIDARALSGNQSVSVKWFDPASFDYVKVVRRTDRHAEHMDDGDVVFQGFGGSYVDSNLQNGSRYFYTLFACNDLGECSEGVKVDSVPNNRLIVVGFGKDREPRVRLYDYTGKLVSEFLAYPSSFRGGVNVTTADVNGDGVEEIITGAGEGGGPQVRVFDWKGNPLYGGGFFAYSPSFRGGVNVAAGDLNNDGANEIITGSGDGGGPQVRVFDRSGNTILNDGFFAYPEHFRGGVYVGTGDLNGDGKDEIITGAGNGGGPQVRVFNQNGESTITNGFFAYGANFRGGVLVDAADLDFDGKDEIIAGSGFTGGPQVRTFLGNGTPTFTPGFFAYNDSFRGGVFVAGHDLNGDGKHEIITGTGYSGGPHVRVFTRYGVPYLTPGFFADDVNSRSGINVTAGNF